VRRATAPGSHTVPITQPTIPSQLDGPWGTPRLFVASESSLLVAVGPSLFDGGSLITNFSIQWDTSPSFNTGKSKSSLGAR
jgi:hypothetical protein